MKKTLFFSLALMTAMSLSSCGGDKNAAENETTAESAEAVEEAGTEDTTINGLEPGAQYQAYIEGFAYDITLYKDGSSTSSQGGDGSWFFESIHDEPFVVVSLNEASGKLYIDRDQNIHIKSASAKGYKLERINYIPEGAQGMIVGKKYTMPKYRSGTDAYVTLNEDGTVTFEFNGGKLDYSNWKRVDIDGKEWTIFYWQRFYEVGVFGSDEKTTKENNGGFLVSPSLEYYLFGHNDKRIKYLDGELTLNDNWQRNRDGRLKE